MEFSMFTYPAKITKDGDFFLVSFRDFYGNEPVTQGQTYEEVLSMASDWLLSEATIALDDKEKLPKASPAKKGEVLIRMPLSAQIKLRLLYEMIDQSISGSELARRMNIKRPSVQNIIKADHATKIDTLQRAFNALGKELVVELRSTTSA